MAHVDVIPIEFILDKASINFYNFCAFMDDWLDGTSIVCMNFSGTMLMKSQFGEEYSSQRILNMWGTLQYSTPVED